MKHVSEIMSRPVVNVTGDASLEKATAKMDEAGVRHLPVVERGRLVGILSERELLEATGWLPASVLERDLERSAGRGQLEGTPVAELCAKAPFTLAADARASEGARAMVAHSISALPVVDGEELLGILTSTDLLRHCVDAFHTESRTERGFRAR